METLAALRAAGLLEGPPLARATARLRAGEHAAAWALGLHAPELLLALADAAKDEAAARHVAAILRDRALERAFAGDAVGFVDAALAAQGFAMAHHLQEWEGWLLAALAHALPPMPPPPPPPKPPPPRPRSRISSPGS